MTKYLLKFEDKIYWYDNAEVFAIYLIDGITEETLTPEIFDQYGVVDFPKNTLISALNFLEILTLDSPSSVLRLDGEVVRFERCLYQTDWVVVNVGTSRNLSFQIKKNIKALLFDSKNIKMNITFNGKDFYYWNAGGNTWIKTGTQTDMTDAITWTTITEVQWDAILNAGRNIEQYKFTFMFITNTVRDSHFRSVGVEYSYDEEGAI